MNRMQHVAEQRAEIEADMLFPRLLQEAELCHRIMYVAGHSCLGMELAEYGTRIGSERCTRCGATATIEVAKLRGHDAVVLLILPPGMCPDAGSSTRPTTELIWLAPYTNNAPDGGTDEGQGR